MTTTDERAPSHPGDVPMDDVIAGLAPFWLNVQTQHDLDPAEDRVAGQIEAITPLEVA